MIVAATDQLERAQRFLGAIPGATERAMSRALNRAITSARAASIEAITERYELKPSDLRDALTLRTASPSDLQVSITARSGSMPLHYFPHAPTQPGTGGPGKPALTATVIRAQTKPVPGAFVAQIGGKPRIVTRTGAKTKSGKQGLRVLYTVPIGDMLGVESVRIAVEAKAVEVLDQRLEHEIDRELQKAGGA